MVRHNQYYFGARSQRGPTERHGSDGRRPSVRSVFGTPERIQQTYDIFEGTEQIQQLVIARAISGLRIE
jgi:hypothetical protein